MKLVHLLIFLLCISIADTYGQQCEWLRHGTGLRMNYPTSITVNDSDDVVVVGNFDSTLIAGDSTFNAPGISGYASFIAKYTHEGKALWSHMIKYPESGRGGNISDVACDKQNNVYVIGAFGKSVDFGNGNIISHVVSFESGVYLAKYNSKGVFLWAKKVTGRNLYWASNYLNEISLSVDAQGSPVFILPFSGRIMPEGGSSIVISQIPFNGLAVIKYNSNGVFQWSKKYEGYYGFDKKNDVATDGQSNIYILTTTVDSITAAKKIPQGDGTCLIKLDASGNDLDAFRIYNDRYVLGTALAVFDDGRVAMVLDFADSAEILGTKIYRAPGASSANQFVALLNSNFTLNWVLKNTGAGSVWPAGISIRNNNIYFGGFIHSTDKFEPFTVTTSVFGGFYFVKTDTLANVLWAFAGPLSTGNSAVRGVATDSYGNGFITGEFYKTLNIFGKTANANPASTGPDFFVAKIVDYTITRGYVYPGPYCAGDSILIPFTKTGKYDWGNEFIAEISDSSGSFDAPVELGRLKDTVGGIIRGTLPLLNVPTNNKYRIRVLSTHPGVTSFYKRDTLRLLIFSRDTANAGPDITLCTGQATHLSVTGGSRWQWSPGVFMPNPGDSVNRRPFVKPDSTTEFRIIISDSSGCGLTDTDYVKVIIRLPLQAAVSGPDSICRGDSAILTAAVTGGDSSKYYYIWQSASPGGYITIQSGYNQSLSVSPHRTAVYRLISGDSCSEFTDTAVHSLAVDTIIKVTVINDTIICKGYPVTLKADGLGCNPSKHKYTWVNKQSGITEGNQPSLTVTPALSVTYLVILADTVGMLYDTAEVTVAVNDTFILTTSADTTICVNGTATLTALVASCHTSGIVYTWMPVQDTSQKINGARVSVNPSANTTYRVVAFNGFNDLADTGFVKVTLRPPLAVTIDATDSICEGKLITLRATASGGDTTKHSFKWTNGLWSSNLNPAFHNPLTTGYYKVTLSDNCSPAVTDSFKITVLPLPFADFDVSPTAGCPPLLVTFTDKSFHHDATLNTWKILPAEAPGVTTHTHPFYTGGNYNFGLIVSNKFGCTDDTSRNVRVEVYPKPTASFFIKPEIKEVEEPLLLYNTSQNGNTYTWDFGNGATLKQSNRNDTTFTYADSGTYTINLIAENDKGCRDTTRQTIRVFDKIWCTIPNAFTPNGDGLNPVFAPVCVGVAHYTLTIYNRWGQVLYNCENCAWDGTYDGTPVIDGVYMYKIDLKGENRRKSTVFGTVNVLR